MFFSLQMVQAIQVLRFHLLELEKVSIYIIIIGIHLEWRTGRCFIGGHDWDRDNRIDSGQTTLGPVPAPPVLYFENYFEFGLLRSGVRRP